MRSLYFFLNRLLLDEGVSLLVWQMSAVQLTGYNDRVVSEADLSERTAVMNATRETESGILTIKSSVS